MLSSERDSFFNLLNAANSVTVMSGGRSNNLSFEAEELWWNALSPYSLRNVRKALSMYVQNPNPDKSKFSPTPGDIISIINLIDGKNIRPGADEAWAMIPLSESESAVMTNEMQEALLIAQPVIDRGDRIEARMTFKDAYNRIVEQNTIRHIKPRWVVSLGWDVSSRNEVLRKSVIDGRIDAQSAVAMLPPQEKETFVLSCGPAAQHLLPPPETQDEKDRNLKNIKLIRAALNGKISIDQLREGIPESRSVSAVSQSEHVECLFSARG